MMIGRILREPLLHFLLIGAALFAYYGHVAPAAEDSRRISVTQAEVNDMVRQFQGTWSRSPTPQELQSLIDSYVHDEIMYREGQALGLGRDDLVIKRRIRQKLDVMAEEEIAQDVPSDADLGAYLAAHAAAYERPATVSFEQILLGAGGAEAAIGRRIDAINRELKRGVAPAKLGQPTLLPQREQRVTQDQVSRDFGDRFAARLAELPLGQWSGPVESEFGLHLVRVEARTEPMPPQLSDVRMQVARDWTNEQRKRALDASYQKLRKRYEVVIEAAPLQEPRP